MVSTRQSSVQASIAEIAPAGDQGVATSALRGARAGAVPFDPRSVRRDFPAVEQELRPGVPLVYLDSAATSLKPRSVIRAVRGYDADYSATVHRGLHTLSERATEAYESARARVARFIGAAGPDQIVFTRGTTDSINLVAQSWGDTFLRAGDEIVVSALEHHSNLLPWQMLVRRVGVVLKFAEMTEDGRLSVGAFERQISERTRMFAVTAMSNVLGTIPPVGELIDMARRCGALVLVDAAQAVGHLPMDVTALDVDFVAFSAHKMCGPTGVGVLYAKREHLEAMPPVMGGGGMVMRVDRQCAEWNDVPWKFEAGTPPIAQAIGLGAAADYLARFDREALRDHERRLTEHAHRALSAVAGVRLLGPEPAHKGGVIGFTVEGLHPHDLAQLLDRSGVAIRAGHHCAMPLHERLGLEASARASVALYNTLEEIDRLADAIEGAKRVFRRRGSG